ncbi:hypothetical protein F8S13_14630 [Chloroflexia bacterium SDU3-3]|nr:hypothetical protein F8S13_14630 [Chloroflexia bacterium SDU3-3]
MSTSPEPHTYAVGPRYCKMLLFSAIPLSLAMAIFALVLIARDQCGPGVALLAVWLAAAWGNLAALRRTVLRVTAEGIAFNRPGLALEAAWADAERIDERYRQHSLLLRRGAATHMGMWTRMLRATSTSYREVDRRIPLYMFDWDAHSPLYRDIVLHAPHLLPSAPLGQH